MRIILAGVLGGALIFICGAVSHVVLHLGESKMRHLGDETALIDFLRSQKLAPGVYGFPDLPADTPAEKIDEVYEKVNERYKQGPGGLLVIAPTGDDMMGPRELITEALTNLGAALIAALILTLLAPGTSFPVRWLIVVLIGVAGWLSVDASYAIWYRLPWPFIVDGLLAALFEFGVAGIVIAAIAKPRTPLAA